MTLQKEESIPPKEESIPPKEENNAVHDNAKRCGFIYNCSAF